MAADLGALPTTKLWAQLCGDAHLANFGLFAAPDRTVVFDVNDFDETSPGPFEWDVLRLATSFVLAAEQAGVPAEKAGVIVGNAARGYREQMAIHAQESNLDTWYSRIDIGFLRQWVQREGKAARGTMEKSVAKAETRDVWSALDKMTRVVDGQRRLIDRPPLVMPLPLESDVAHRMNEIIQRYAATLPPDRAQLLDRYDFVDVGHKVVGVGSVGLLAIVTLLQGRDGNDVLALQSKQAVGSVLEPFTKASAFAEHGQRVVVGQQLMQAATDPLLGWVTSNHGRSFYVRQLRDKKFSPDITTMKPAVMGDYAMLCGRALARAHARSGDPISIDAYLGKGDAFDRAVTSFAFAYAGQVRRDFTTFTEAIADGRVSLGSPEAEQHLSLGLDEQGSITVVSQ